jgi:prolipoprotein diacylglyceryltransferase
MSLTTPVFISWGGILGGVSAALISAKVWKIPLPDFADLCAPAYLTGIGIGRIGCYLGGG